MPLIEKTVPIRHKGMDPDRIAAMQELPRNYNCPHCAGEYRIVRVQMEPGKTYRELSCRVCHQPMPSTEEDKILKYFLVRRRGQRRQV
jgi:transcription elongation factor Elf1